MRNNEAQICYEEAVASLNKYCEKETDLAAIIFDEEYPFRVQFVPDYQLSVEGNENVDENGEVNDLTVTVGLVTTVKSTLKFKMPSDQLKKLIKLSEKVGNFYYHAFREEAGDLRPDPADEEIQEMLREVVGDEDGEEAGGGV